MYDQTDFDFDAPRPPAQSAAGAIAARDQAMAQVEEHASEDWKFAAREAVYRVCVAHPAFLVDEIWPEFERVSGTFAYTGTHDKRAMGPIVTQAAKEGWCQSGPKERSKIVGNHGNWRTLWRSLLYRAPEEKTSD